VRVYALVIVAAALLMAAEGPKDDAAEKEYVRFEGTWRFVSVEVEGRSVPAKHLKSSRLVLKGNQFTMTEGQATYRGTFKVDTAPKPKRIDVTFTEGPERGKTTGGIYELDGDTYKVCMALPGKNRPSQFASRPGSGHVLEILRRDKDAAKENLAEEEWKGLQGTWQLVSAETDGKKAPAEQVKQIRVVIQGKRHTVYFGDKAVVEGVDFRIGPTTRPKRVEDTLKDGTKIRGIYERNGDPLRSCVAPAGKEPPTEFTARAGTGYTLRVFRRVKPDGVEAGRPAYLRRGGSR
jgi:uncharacterized protein (TIGR03067 family)